MPRAELHGQGGCAATIAAVADQVVVGPAEQRVVVDAAVGEEAAVLDGGDGLDQRGRQLVVGDDAAFGAVGAFGEAGDELGLELVGGELLLRIAGDAGDHAIVEGDCGAFLRMVGLRAGMHADAVAAKLIGAHRRGAAAVRAGITGGTELLGDGRSGKLLSHADLARRGVDARRQVEERLRQALVDDLFVFVGVVAEGDAENKQREGTDDADEDQHRLPEWFFGDDAVGREL